MGRNSRPFPGGKGSFDDAHPGFLSAEPGARWRRFQGRQACRDAVDRGIPFMYSKSLTTALEAARAQPLQLNHPSGIKGTGRSSSCSQHLLQPFHPWSVQYAQTPVSPITTPSSHNKSVMFGMRVIPVYRGADV